MRVSLITTCMGRINHLIHSLPTMLNQFHSDFDYEVVVVCYGDEEAYNYCDEFRSNGHSRLRPIYVRYDYEPKEQMAVPKEEVRYFNPARARNIAACLSYTDIFAFVDADYLLPRTYLQDSLALMGNLPMLNVKHQPKEGPPCFTGACLVTREVFHKVRGYDERFGTGYGHEDSDFYRRIWREEHFDGAYWYAPIGYLAHDDSDRTRNFRVNNMAISIPQNVKLHEERTGRNNPYGYGLTGTNDYSLLIQYYPWPKTKPRVPGNYGPRTWDETTINTVLLPNLNQEMKCIVEIGSWSGFSALKIAKTCPQATILCIDPWDGYANPEGDYEPALYEKFIQNLWDERYHVIPMRCSSYDGLRELYRLGVEPDLIFIDGDHINQVFDDVIFSCTHFPTAKIVGDDYNWKNVRKAVDYAAATYNMEVRITAEEQNEGYGIGWELCPKEDDNVCTYSHDNQPVRLEQLSQ